MTWADIWNGIVNFFATSGLTILKGIGLWIAGFVVVKLFILILKKVFSKTKMEKVTQGFFLSVIKFALYVILLVMVLKQFGVEITGLVATLAAAGVAIGLALKDSLSNVASGIILLINHPFKEGDYVSVNGVEGKVKNIKILTTALITYDNKLVVLPNSAVANNAIINYSNRRVRRVEFLFKVDYSTDVDLMKKVVTDVMKSDGRVQLQPAPFCSIKSFDEDGIEFFCHCWCASEDYWDVFYYIMDNVFNEFKRNKIKIPHKQIELRMKENEKELPVREQPLPERCNEKKVELEQEETLESFFKKFDGRNWGKKDSEKRRLKKEQKAKEKAEKQSKKSKQKLEKKVSNTQTSSQSLIANGENSSNASSDERNEN